MIDIETFLHPSSRRQLVEHHWDRTPLYIPGARDKFAKLGFDMEIFFRLCLQIAELKAAYFDQQGKHRELPITGAQARSLYDSGMTICAPRLNDVHDGIAACTRELKRALSLPGPAWANCYLSPAGKGFGLHFDDRSAFVVQIDGSKRWSYSTTPAMVAPPQNVIADGIDQLRSVHPWVQLELPEQSTFQEQLLSPGDIFYMPAGTWHRAAAGERSLALTIGFRSASFADLMGIAMERELQGHAEWRRDLPALADAQDEGPVRQIFSQRIAQLQSWVASLSAETLLAEWRKSVASDGKQPNGGDPRAIERSDWLIVPHQPSCTAEGDQLVITCQGSSFAVPIELRSFIERLAARKTFVADEALGWCEADEELDWADVREALQTLLEAGIIRRHAGA